MKGGTRVDVLLQRQGHFESRSRAQAAIMAGLVRIGADHVIRRSSESFAEDTVFNVSQPYPYVSRGAEKLLPALDTYLPRLDGRVALDIGSSTGGFTDLMLQRGAERVYAIDVGTGQLHAKLREDPRVMVREKTNARHLTDAEVGEPVSVMTADVSFISLRKVLPAAAQFLQVDGWAFTLVKPQFEAERGEVGKGGVVRDTTVRERVVREICSFAESALSWQHVAVLPSPITGPKGNQEYIAVFRGAEAP
ncbi:MAG: 23S rRNA (cytidine1920-2'-O)/16S rRNA (cytidine1409-2'-O)-methyltransferase [Rhodothermales bacterium]|jgi:23S rRNA (cytidine1920-2'-O)/16S rRNA (cytidine1409-2'-O)-methyltransferase